MEGVPREGGMVGLKDAKRTGYGKGKNGKKRSGYK